MSGTSCQEVIVNWHPPMGDGSLAPDIPLPTVHGELEPTPDKPLTLFLVGLGEGRASGEAVVSHWENELGLPAAAAWLSYRALPVCEANLTRIAVEAPLALAEYYGGNQPVNLVTNSLGCLGVNAAAEAPERFSYIASVAPYALANEYRGRLPLLGSPFLLRAGALGISLGVRTVLQHWSNRDDPNLQDVVWTAYEDARLFGLSCYRTALDHALSVKIGQRTADSYIKLAADHQEHIVVGTADRLVNTGHVRGALGKAAARLGVDRGLVDGMLHEVDGPHSPWCIPLGLQQLKPVTDVLSGLTAFSGRR